MRSSYIFESTATRMYYEWEVETLGIATINPTTGETLETFEPLTDVEISAKLERAGQAFEQYRKTPLGKRFGWLQATAEILEREKEQFDRHPTWCPS